jgi:hypothetical protein
VVPSLLLAADYRWGDLACTHSFAAAAAAAVRLAFADAEVGGDLRRSGAVHVLASQVARYSAVEEKDLDAEMHRWAWEVRHEECPCAGKRAAAADGGPSSPAEVVNAILVSESRPPRPPRQMRPPFFH